MQDSWAKHIQCARALPHIFIVVALPDWWWTSFPQPAFAPAEAVPLTSLGAVRTVALEIVKLGPPMARLLAT